MKLSWRSEWPHCLLLAAMFAMAILIWPAVPDRIPVHWGVDGHPDGFGGRFEGLLLLPATALLIYVIMLFLPRIDPRRDNYEAFAGPYTIVRFSTIAFLAILYGIMVLAMRGRDINMTSAALALMGALLMVMGGVMSRLRPNWFIGIRTPWTLSSEQAWTSTHRLGGLFFIVSGGTFLAAALVGRPWAFWAAMAFLVVGVIGLTGYSYYVWKNSPDRIRGAGSR